MSDYQYYTSSRQSAYMVFTPYNPNDLPEYFLQKFKFADDPLTPLTIDEIKSRLSHFWEYTGDVYDEEQHLISSNLYYTNHDNILSLCMPHHHVEDFVYEYHYPISCTYYVSPEPKQYEEISGHEEDYRHLNVQCICLCGNYPYETHTYGQGYYRIGATVYPEAYIPYGKIIKWEYEISTEYSPCDKIVQYTQNRKIIISNLKQSIDVSAYFRPYKFFIDFDMYHINPYNGYLIKRSDLTGYISSFDIDWNERFDWKNIDDKCSLEYNDIVYLDYFNVSVDTLDEYYQVSCLIKDSRENNRKIYPSVDSKGKTYFNIKVEKNYLANFHDNDYITYKLVVYRRYRNFLVDFLPDVYIEEDKTLSPLNHCPGLGYIDSRLGRFNELRNIKDVTFLNGNILSSNNSFFLSGLVEYNENVKIHVETNDEWHFFKDDKMQFMRFEYFTKKSGSDVIVQLSSGSTIDINVKNIHNIPNPYSDTLIVARFQSRVVTIIYLTDVCIGFNSSTNPLVKMLEDKVKEIEKSISEHENDKLIYKTVILDRPSKEELFETLYESLNSRMIFFVQMTHGSNNYFSVDGINVSKNEIYDIQKDIEIKNGIYFIKYIIPDIFYMSGSCHSDTLSPFKVILKDNPPDFKQQNIIFSSSNLKSTIGIKWLFFALSIQKDMSYEYHMEQFKLFRKIVQNRMIEILESYSDNCINLQNILDTELNLYQNTFVGYCIQSGIFGHPKIRNLIEIIFGINSDSGYFFLTKEYIRSLKYYELIHEYINDNGGIKYLIDGLYITKTISINSIIDDIYYGIFNELFTFGPSLKILWNENLIPCLNQISNGLIKTEEDYAAYTKKFMAMNFELYLNVLYIIAEYVGYNFEKDIKKYITLPNHMLDISNIVPNIVGCAVFPFISVSNLISLFTHEILHDETNFYTNSGYDNFLQNKFLQYDKFNQA